MITCAASPLLLEALSDLEFAALRRWCGRHGDLEHAVVEARLGLLGDRAFGQRDHSVEAAVGSLAAIVAFAIFFALALALALDGDGILGDLHRDLVLLQAWQVGSNRQLVVVLVLEDLDLGSPQITAGLAP